MPTPTEKRIIRERAAKKTGAILVPILESVLENECIPETPQDFHFMDMLVRARALPRRKGVYSPSMLGSCVRQAYFARRGEEKVMAHSPQTNGYFLHGNFIHLKWQFALWRAHTLGMLELVPVPIDEEEKIVRQLFLSGDEWHSDELYCRHMDALNFWGNNTRPGVEVRVIVDDDFGGTIDALVSTPPYKKIEEIPLAHVVDFKGINVIDFQRTIKKGAKKQYRVQIVGYGDNVNRSELPVRVQDCLLISENKAGPVNSASQSPLALHETRVQIEEHLPEVKRRLRTLRWFNHRDEVPPPECVSTLHMGFQECPFNRHCRDEVREVQKEREQKAAKKSKPLSVARPGR